VRLEGLRQLKDPMISTEIEPATFRLVACASTNYAIARPAVKGKIKTTFHVRGFVLFELGLIFICVVLYWKEKFVSTKVGLTLLSS
jgi:hypothetical protein